MNHQSLPILSVALLERILLSQVLTEPNYKYERSKFITSWFYSTYNRIVVVFHKK